MEDNTEIVYSEVACGRYHDVIHHLRRNFFADEPLNRAVSLCQPGEPHSELEAFSASILQHDMSYMATLDSGEVIGAVLNSANQPDPEDVPAKVYQDEKLQKVFDFLGANGSSCMEGCEKGRVFEVKIISVDNRFRGRGIASKLFQLSEHLAKNKGFVEMRTDATALFSQKLFQRFGFETVKEVLYSEYPNKENCLFNVEPPNVSFKVMVKKLK